MRQGLNGSEYQRFRAALFEAFPTRLHLERMVRVDLDENLDYITGSGNMTDAVFGLIRWAESQNRLGDLLEAARRAIPDNPDLNELAVAVGVASPNLSREQRSSLLRALQALPQVRDPKGRDLLLSRFPPELVTTVGRSSVMSIDLTNIVHAAETWGSVHGTSAILTLIDTARELAGDDPLREALDALHQDLGAPSTTAPSAKLRPKLRQKLLYVLGSIPVFDTPDGRQLLLKGMPASLVSQLARSSNKEVDLAKIVGGVEAWGTLSDGMLAIELLIQNALVFSHGSKSSSYDFQRQLAAIEHEITSSHSLSEDDALESLSVEPTKSLESLTAGQEPDEGSFVVKSSVKLAPELLRHLRYALLSAFSQAELEQMVAEKLGENLYSITGAVNSLSEIVVKLLTWAEHRGRTEELVAAALSSNPGNRELRDVATKIGLIPE